MKKLKIAIIREGKIPQDTRAAIIPKHARKLLDNYPDLEIRIEPSDIRCYSDEEYRKYNLAVTENIDDCDLFIGVKEVPFHLLIPHKTYMFFSHTIKKQPHNRKMMEEIIQKKIRLIDYELLIDENGQRLIGFGYCAGIVGAHYALMMWGRKKNIYKLKPAILCHDYNEMISHYSSLRFGNPKIVITGAGRVGKGAATIMDAAGIERVKPEDFNSKEFEKAVYTQIDVAEIFARKDKNDFDFHYYVRHPEDHISIFKPFQQNADILINALFWDPLSPRLFESHEVKSKNFKIRTIADISCDINGSVPLTHRASAISDPVFGFDRHKMEETLPYSEDTIDMMTVDNLPNELPRDAAKSFSEVMTEKIIPLYIENPHQPVFERATIAENGHLKPDYQYLEDYIQE